MLIERLYDDMLAQATYLVGCEETKTAIIVDPGRLIDRYIDAAKRARMRIVAVTETHIHADFVSGARELARESGASLLLSAEGGEDWQYRFAAESGARLLHHGDQIDVGTVRIQALHTPGHTPEHLSFLVTDTTVSDRPVGLLTGDFIFVGDVGRPDLLERAANQTGTMDGLARRLFRSLKATESLPDYLQIWPGHGAGSACGKSLGAMPTSTMGYERLVNWAFQIAAEDEFVRQVTAGQPEPPKYFARMKTINRAGPEPLPRQPLAALSFDAIQAALDAGDPVIDVRATKDFAESHVPGTINIPVGTSFATWAGSLLPYDRPIVILADDADRIQRARAILQSIGLDDVAGYADAEFREAWLSRVSALQSTPQVDVKGLASDEGRTIIDVRRQSEWDEGHIPGARHAYLGNLVELTKDLPRDMPIAVHCQGGTRSAIAASVLQREGFTNVSNVSGGIEEWSKKGLPLEKA